jgi:preprotein translocase subunit SecF
MSAFARAYRGSNDVDFPKWSKRMLVVSAVLMVVSVASLLTQGLQLSLDFEGGSVWAVESADFDRSDAQAVLADFEVGGDLRYQEATSADGVRLLRITSGVDDVDTGSAVADALADAAGVDTGNVTVNTIGPSWGDDITRQAVLSLVWFTVLVSAYLAWRLEPKMALAAMIAVLHDVVITAGVYSVLRLEVTPATVIAFLTILGFSLYDTVVVFDRMKDGAHRYGRTGQYTYTAITRRSLNQSLMRCVNTSITTILPILSMLIIGGYVLDQPLLTDFSLALLIGLVLGVYSSLYVAAPIEMYLKERDKRWTEIRKRLVAKGVDVTDTRWHEPKSTVTTSRPVATSGAARTGDAPALTVNVGGHPPRPRKTRKR